MSQRTILLIDDSPTFRTISCVFLKNMDLRVLEASDGAEALWLMDTHTIDMVLTDNRMPVLSGLVFCRVCEILEALGADVPAYAATGVKAVPAV